MSEMIREASFSNPNVSNSNLTPDTLNPDLMTVLGEPDEAVVAALHPDSLSLQDDLEGTVRELHRLPFMTTRELAETLHYPEGLHTGQLVKDAQFPISRIVAVQGFQSWAGRGRNRRGGIIDNGGYASASAVHYYAGKDPDPEYQPSIQLFKDRDGIVWGFMNNDGAHRTAGAKARGDKVLQCTAYTDTYDRLPTSDASIGEIIQAQSRRRNRFLGKVVLARQAKHLAKDSLVYDKQSAKSRAEIGAMFKAGKGRIEFW